MNKQINHILFYCFVGAFLILSVFNVYHSYKMYIKIKPALKHADKLFEGSHFQGLERFLEGETHVSYLTDRDLTSDSKKFSQAQYLLAPIVLDPDNLTHRFAIIDCTQQDIALAVIKKLGAKPLKANNYGIILVELNHV